MNILGINYYFHDSSACVVSNGKPMAAVEEERLTRHKHTGAFPRQAIDCCLKLAGLDISDIDHVALSIKPTKDLPAKTLYWFSHLTQSRSFLRHEVINRYFRQRNLWIWFNQIYGSKKKRPTLHFVPHHVSHAAGSFLVSPYDDAAILSLGGSGEWATSFLGHGKGIDVEAYQQSYFPMSLGSVYEAVTEFCGFRPNYDEGKTMGFASFGLLQTGVRYRQGGERRCD